MTKPALFMIVSLFCHDQLLRGSNYSDNDIDVIQMFIFLLHIQTLISMKCDILLVCDFLLPADYPKPDKIHWRIWGGNAISSRCNFFHFHVPSPLGNTGSTTETFQWAFQRTLQVKVVHIRVIYCVLFVSFIQFSFPLNHLFSIYEFDGKDNKGIQSNKHDAEFQGFQLTNFLLILGVSITASTRSLWEGNVFSRVCLPVTHCVCPQGDEGYPLPLVSLVNYGTPGNRACSNLDSTIHRPPPSSSKQFD